MSYALLLVSLNYNGLTQIFLKLIGLLGSP